MKPNAERNRPRIPKERPDYPPTPKPGAVGFLPHESTERLFRAIQAHYLQQDRRVGVYAVTGAGEFVPSSLTNVRRGLVKLMDEGILRSDHTFLDAGSGDGRVVILVSLIFGLKTFGVEYDDALWRRSLDHVAIFRPFYRTGNALPTLLCGDFCDEETYIRHGMAFRNFDVVFNYANDHHRLAAKVARDGAEHVLFLCYGPIPFPESFPGLVTIRSLALGNGAAQRGSFLHAYRKGG